MSTIGVRAAKAIGTTLSQVVKKANASGVIQMKPSGALTKAGKDVYQSALKREGVKSVEALIAVSKKKVAESFSDIVAKVKQSVSSKPSMEELAKIRAEIRDIFTGGSFKKTKQAY